MTFYEGASGGDPVAVTGVTVAPTSKSIVPDETFTITPTVSPAGASNKSVSWSSSATSYATVSSGVVAGVAAGTATITCTTTDGGFTATCAVTVRGVTVQARDEDGNTIAAGGPGAPTRSGTTITAAANAGNYVFKEWQVTNATAASTTTSPTTISNPTGAVTVTAVYYKPITITYKANGSTFTTQTYAYNGTLAFPASNPDGATYSCTGKTFVGWVGEANKNYSHASTAPTYVSAGGSVTEAATYYAVFADAAGGDYVYTKVTSISAGTYVMVSEKTASTYRYMPNTTSSGSNPPLGSGITMSTTNGVTTLTNSVTAAMLWDFTLKSGSVYYIRPHGSTTIGLGTTNSTGANIRISTTYVNTEWTIATSNDYGWQFKNNASTNMYLAVYADDYWRNYSSSTTNQNGTFYLFKQSGGTTYSAYSTTCAVTHTVSSAVNPTGKATVTLGATSVAEGSTTTATYSAITAGYEFVNWTISGTGATLSSTTANPTTITMGTGDVSVTANLQCITPSISVQPAASTTCLVGATPSLSVTAAAGGASLSYQWKQCATVDGTYVNVANGGNSSTYSPSTASAGTTYYKCVVTNAAAGCSTNETSNAAQVTVNAPSGWKFKYSGDSWEEHTMNESAGVASCSISLAADSRFEFGIDDNGAAFYKNNGTIITTTSGWVFNTSDGNCHIHTGPAGTYTFAINTTTKAVTVTYPSVTHPNEHYVYFKNSDVWGTVYGYLANSGNDNKAAAWPGSVMSATTTICGETYHYAALNAMSGTYNVIIFNNGSGGYGNQTSDLSADGLGKFNANTDDTWHDFKYTITYAGNGNTGGSMTNVSNICIGSSQTLAANAFTKSDHTFTGWKADVDVKIGGNTVTAGTLIADAATIQNIQSNITLTAQWTHVPVITVSEASRAFGDRKVNGGPYTMTFNVEGSYLKGNISLAVSGANSAMFDVTPKTLTASEGSVSSTEITVSYSPTGAGSHSAQVDITSTDATSKTVALTGTGKWEVIWSVNGVETQSLVANSTKPTLPSPNPGSCDLTSTTFIGWATTSWSDKIGDVSDKTIHADNSTMSNITANGTKFYAVWAKSSGGGSTTYTFGWESADNETPWNLNNFDLKGSYSTYKSGGSYAGSTQGKETSYIKYSSKLSPTSISCKYTKASSNTNSSSKFIIQTSTDGSSWTDKATGKTMNNVTQGTFETLSWSGELTDVYVRIYYTGTSAVRVLDDVSITASSAATYSDYMTTCCDIKPVTSLNVSGTTANSVTLTWTAPSPTTGIDHLELRNASTHAKVGSDIAVGTTTVTVSELTECTEYSYYVASVGATCEVSSSTVDAQPFSGAKTVTYNYHDGTGSPESFTTACGNPSTTLPTPTRENYRFDGWYDAATSGNLVGAGGASYTPAADITLHAYWTRVYTVTYNYMGGTSSCSDATTYAAGATVTVCAAPPTKSGSSFQGWLGDNEVGTKTAGSTFTMPAADVTLTAQWQDTPYTLTHSGSNYSNTEEKTDIKSGDTSPSGLTLNYTCTGTYGFPGTISITGGGKATWTAGTDYTWTVDDSKQAAALVIAETIISANVTVSITMKTRYAVTYNFPVGNISGAAGTLVHYFVNDEAQTLKEVTGVSCLDFDTFEGWTPLADTLQGDQKALKNPVLSGSYTATGSISLYAMYSHNDATATGYKKITSGVTAGTYLIVADDYGKAYKRWNTNSYGDTANVTVSSSTISAQKNAREITISLDGTTGNFYMYDAGKASDESTDTKYLSYSGSSNGLYHSATNSSDNQKWKLNNDGMIESIGVSGRVLKYNSSQPRFACYSSGQQAVYLYKKGGKIYNSVPNCVMYNITIADTDDGEVTTVPAAGTSVAAATSLVTVNVIPNSCKYLSALKYNDGSNDYDINISSTPYTFIMPEADVTVTATFSDKSVTSVAPLTDTHRILVQNTAFVGERIRVTYNSGETEDLEWNDATLTFSGYNMSTLDTYTVTVSYVGTCGSASTTYSIEVMDGIPVRFVDAGEATTVKYNLGDLVDVESLLGRYAATCDGWDFAGWSETSVADNSTSFTPIRNFNASTARTLYAVYADTTSTWLSAFDETELKSGATYVIVAPYSDSKHVALTNTTASTSYLAGSVLSTVCERIIDANNDYRYKLTVAPNASWKWQLYLEDGYWRIRNISLNKYLKLNSDGTISLTNSVEDEFTFDQNNNDSQLYPTSRYSSKMLSWYNSSNYWMAFTSGRAYYCTNVNTFSSNPPCAPRSVIFHGNGGTVSDGENVSSDLVVTEANRGDGITTPVATMDAADCNGNVWQFVGWLDSELARTQIPVLTTDLLNDGGGNQHHAIHADDEEYYAVYSNTGMPETKYGTITFTKDNIGQNYVNSEQTTIMSVTSMGDYTFGYVDLGHQSSIGMQFESGLGELYNKTSLGKINSISFTNFTAGGISNLRVYVGDEEKATTHLLEAEEMQHIDGSNTWTYYPSDKYSYLYIKDNSGYVNVQSISIDFGKGSVVYASAPDCTLRVTYKAAGEEDHVVEIGGDDSHDLPAYYPALGCDDKEFIGWAEAGIASLQQTAPTIYTADGSLTGVSAPKTLYAVYASRNGGKVTGSHTLTEDFESYLTNMTYSNTGLTFNNANGLSWVIDYGNVTNTGATYFGGGCTKDVVLSPYQCYMNSGSSCHLQSNSIVKDVIGVSVWAGKGATDITGTLLWSANGVVWEDKYLGIGTLVSSSTKVYRTEQTFSEPKDLYIKLRATEVTPTSGKYLYLNDIVFTIADRTYYYTDYSTTCETASAPVALTWAEVAGSTIETGTEPATSALGNLFVLPTLSKDNYRFDGWKVTINGDQKADVYLGGETFLINHPVTFTAQWTEIFEVSDPAYGVTSYKDITTMSETFTMTVKGTHSITPVVDGLSDDTHFAVTITTPGTNDGDDTDFTYTFTYTPDAFGTGSGAATHTATFRFKDETSGAVSEEVTIRGRSLPEEFVIAVKNNDKWYALPGDLQHTSAQPAIVPVEIMVNDNTTPTAALLAPQTALYKAANRYTPANTTALRFTVTGSNYLQVSGIEGTYNMWLSNTGGTDVQDWQLHSTDFNAYELTIPSNAYPTKKMGIYNGSYMGYHTSPSNSQIYLLPVDAEYTPREAKVKEWGR
ncbi:MAG: InlB B-repeat-containing protein [Paludibacteraceae bacterium]|nr:InlB B-repeat-containing protein [Paludibacteraceae bacterium]